MTDDQPDGAEGVVEPDVSAEDTEETFDRLVDEGRQRLGRSWLALIATGLLGGLDIGVGVLALLIVEEATGNIVLSSLAFAIGFIALSLAKSELFTEDFLIPVATVVAKEATFPALLRLWASTLCTNLIGGWAIVAIVMAAFPSLRETAVHIATGYIDLGIDGRAFALAVVGGMLITLMTHLQHSTESDGVRLVPAVAFGFVLSAGHINHAIVASLICFAGLIAGAPFGYADWLGMFAFAAVGNMLGGLGLVTVLRLMQVPHKVLTERAE